MKPIHKEAWVFNCIVVGYGIKSRFNFAISIGMDIYICIGKFYICIEFH